MEYIVFVSVKSEKLEKKWGRKFLSLPHLKLYLLFI